MAEQSVDSYEEKLKRILEDMEKLKEGHRLQYDYFKHLTALGGSALLIIVAFLEKVLEKPDYTIFAGISVISYAICVIGSVWVLPVTGNMILYLTGIRMAATPPTKENKETAIGHEKKYNKALNTVKVFDWLTKITLLIGTVAFLIFLMINFPGKSCH